MAQSVLNYCFKLLISRTVSLENSLLYKQLRELLLFLTVLKVAIFSWGYYDIDSAIFFFSEQSGFGNLPLGLCSATS